MSLVQNITVDDVESGSRLDRWFKKRFPHIPHGKVEKLLRTGQLRVDGKRSKGNLRIESGQVIRVPPLPEPSKVKSKDQVSSKEADFLRSIIIYEDSDLIALNKPHGIAVQGGTGTSKHIDGMLAVLGEGCRLVHRLDRDTSGVLIIAKNLSTAKSLGSAFQSRKANKIYWGITNGVPKPSSGEIKGYIAKGRLDNRFGNKHEGKEIMEAVHHGAKGAKYSKTLYHTASKAGQRLAWVVMKPLTGRTHQLRLHMQLLGVPIAGDPKYMTDRPLPGGIENSLHLHARSIILPIKGKESLYIEAPLPPHMNDAFKTLAFETTDPIINWDDISDG
jgi:23S rRNA pseudouridine955/2504/2580 synthase